jgi:hypothetical protein
VSPAIHVARLKLEKYPGCKQVLGNLAFAFIGLGVFYLHLGSLYATHCPNKALWVVNGGWLVEESLYQIYNSHNHCFKASKPNRSSCQSFVYLVHWCFDWPRNCIAQTEVGSSVVLSQKIF